MYTSVYFHKTVRIAEMMLCKAVELSGDKILNGIERETDSGLINSLNKQGGSPQRIITSLKYRKLYKKALMLPISGLNEGQQEQLISIASYQDRKSKEAEIADRSGVDPANIILDIPEKALLLSEPRIGKTEVPILEGERVRPLSRYSPLAKAIQARGVHDWAVMVSAPPKYKEEVERAALKALFS